MKNEGEEEDAVVWGRHEAGESEAFEVAQDLSYGLAKAAYRL